MAGLAAFQDVMPGLVNRSDYARAFLKDNGFPDDMLADAPARADFEALMRVERQEADHADMGA